MCMKSLKKFLSLELVIWLLGIYSKKSNRLEDCGKMEAQMHLACCRLNFSGESLAYRMFSKECL